MATRLSIPVKLALPCSVVVDLCTIKVFFVYSNVSIGSSMIHNCSNPACKLKTQRDESGRGICSMAITRALLAIQGFQKKIEVIKVGDGGDRDDGGDEDGDSEVGDQEEGESEVDEGDEVDEESDVDEVDEVDDARRQRKSPASKGVTAEGQLSDLIALNP